MITTSTDLEIELYGTFEPFPEPDDPALRQDLYSVFLSRASSMRWSAAWSSRPRPEHPPIWGMAEAAAEPVPRPDGLVGYVQVVLLGGPTDPLPLEPFVQCAVDSMRRLGRLELEAVRIGVPLDSHDAATSDPMAAAAWFLAVARPHPVTLAVEVTCSAGEPDQLWPSALAAEIASLHTAPFRITGCSDDDGLVQIDAPEWSAETVGWVVATVADAAVRLGCDAHALVRVARRRG